MSPFPTLTVFAALVLSLAAPAVAANEVEALIKARKFAEAERAANAVLAREPANAQAMIGRADAIMAGGAEARIGDAVKQAQQCVSTHPGQAGCHLALGKALGWKAMAGGVMSALSYAGDMRDAFKKAVELEPRNLDARFSLLQFYMLAPAIMGGGTGKAEALAAQSAALHPDAGRIMGAMLDLAAERVAKAETTAMALRRGAEEELNERHESLLASIGNRHLTDKKFAEAERILRESARRFPDGEMAPYLLVRVQQEQGKHREALAALETELAKHTRARLHYRMGQSLQALGDKTKAASAFEKAIALKSGLSGKQLSDAQAQLAALKG